MNSEDDIEVNIVQDDVKQDNIEVNIVQDDVKHNVKIVRRRINLGQDDIKLDKIFGFIMALVMAGLFISIVIVIGINADKIFNPPLYRCNIVANTSGLR